MTIERLDVSRPLREGMAYNKFSGPLPRILILQSNYWLDVACAKAARAMGWSVESVPVTMRGVFPREDVAYLIDTLLRFKPDFLLTINMSGMDYEGLLARLFEDLAIPYATWFVDDPRTILMGKTTYATQNSVALTWDAGYRDYLLALGFPTVDVLPLAVDDSMFNAPVADTWTHPPTFIGYSNTGLANEEWTWLAERPRLSQAVRVAFEARRVTRRNFALGIEALLRDHLVETLDEHEKRHAELYFFFEQTRQLRIKIARTLIPEGLEVRGDEAWRDTFPSALGPVDYSEDLARFYQACELNLNITSIQMPTAVNQRVFDCPAAGGFLLTDAQASLRELFDVDREIACYQTLDDCRDMFRFFRARPKARRELAERARIRILGEHTYRHRLQALVSLIKSTL